MGDKRADCLTVGTYPEASPMRSLTNALKRQGTQRFAVPQGGTAVQDGARPTIRIGLMPAFLRLISR